MMIMEPIKSSEEARRPSSGTLQIMTHDRQVLNIPSTLLAPLEPPQPSPQIKEESTRIIERSSLRRDSKRALLQFVREMNPAAIAEELHLDHAEIRAIKENNMFITDEDTSAECSQSQHIAKLLDEIDRAKCRLLHRLDPNYDELCHLLDEDTQHELDKSITDSVIEHLRHVHADSPSRLIRRHSTDDLHVKKHQPKYHQRVAAHRHTKRIHTISESIQVLMDYTLSQWIEMTRSQQEQEQSSADATHWAIIEQMKIITTKYRELQGLVEHKHSSKPHLLPSQSLSELPRNSNEETAVMLVSKSVDVEAGEVKATPMIILNPPQHRRFSKPSIVIPPDDIEVLEEDLFSASIEFGGLIGDLICDTSKL